MDFYSKFHYFVKQDVYNQKLSLNPNFEIKIQIFKFDPIIVPFYKK